jgi:hypothetical protein
MLNLIISYAPDGIENRKIVDEVRGAFETAGCRTVVKKAADTSITDLAAADIMLFGLQKPAIAELHPDFNELVRIFKGVNLAGKTVGFFSFNAEKASARLRRALLDSDPSSFDEEPALGDGDSERHADLQGWVVRVTAFHQEARHAG